MDYFSYLSLMDKKDTRQNFISYLIEVLDYTEETAIKTSKIYYSEEN